LPLDISNNNLQSEESKNAALIGAEMDEEGYEV